ncbi:GntR family transcriptional regulator [Pseudonocardia sp. CA-107938]|uniref:GntR family transcriptional regulator n=1 Tax=Pseudonocardia sp. CA-107938 TaxID=3240021 RepID=UPI003D8B75C2
MQPDLASDALAFAPRYRRIEQALRVRLAAMRPDDPLPSEAQLSQEFSVSRMTARAAVTRLVEDGLAYRESGRGTFVAAPPTPRRADNLVRFSAEMRRQGRRPSSRLIHRERRPASAEETRRLRLRAGAQVVAIRRVRLADGEPVAVEDAVFPGDLDALLSAELEHRSLHETLVDLGRVPSTGHATITAANADDRTAHLLQVDDGTALLVEQRAILDQDGEPLELTRSRYVAHRYALEVSFSVDDA